MTRSHFIEMLMILTKYVFYLGVRLTELSVTVESVTLRFYCIFYELKSYWVTGVQRSVQDLVSMHNITEINLDWIIWLPIPRQRLPNMDYLVMSSLALMDTDLVCYGVSLLSFTS